MYKRVGRHLLLIGAVLVLTLTISSLVTAAGPRNSVQVVFSGTGLGNYGNFTNAPFGFWVWCLAQTPPPSNGNYTDCAGAMYFYAAGITKGITGDISGGPSSWTMSNLHSADGAIAGCVLTNIPPVSAGPTNTVILSACTAPAGGSGTSNNAVVNVTGP
jgi:hypothetical protein